jgi:Zn-dependent alcohol dehydrogenase
MHAAVLRAAGAPLELVTADLAPPRAGEVLVRIAATGVCRSDLHVLDGRIPEPFPLVPGHEASATVAETGPGCVRLREGDNVVLTIVPSCGACAACSRGRRTFCEMAARMAATGTLADGTSRLSLEGQPLHHFNSVSSFAEYAVVPESAAVAIPADVPLVPAALIGCAVLTGFGAVTNVARVAAGARVAVFGCGGVGLSAVQAARLARAAAVVAVDVQPHRLAIARRLGATATVVAADGHPVADAVREAAGGGIDHAIEAIGSESAIREAWSALDPGGQVVVAGILPKGREIALDAWRFLSDVGIRGTYLGSADVHADVPRLVELYQRGELALDELVTDRIRLEQLPGAFARMRAGAGVRTVVVFD